MSQFTPSVFYETTFDGDTYKFRLNRLTRKQFMKLAPYIKDGQVGESELTEFIDNVVEELKPQVTLINEVFTEAGDQITVDTIIEQAYFMPLLADVISNLIVHSVMGKTSGAT